MARSLEFAHFLQRRMEELNIGQSDLADMVDVSPTAFWNWKRGTQPKSGLVGPLSAALQVARADIARLTGHALAGEGAGAPATSLALVDRLGAVMATLPADRLQTLLDFAEYLGMRDWREEQQRFALANLARAYGEDEPQYTLADLKP